MLSELLLKQRKYDQAISALSSITANSSFEIDDAYATTIENAITMVDVFEQLDDLDGRWDSLDISLKTTVENIAVGDPLIGGNGARTLLSTYEGRAFPAYVLAEESESAKTLSIVGTKDEEIAIIYPNPVNQQLNVTIDIKYVGCEYSVMNYNGQILKTGKLSNSASVINMANLASGVYIFKVVTSNNATYFSRFTKL